MVLPLFGMTPFNLPARKRLRCPGHDYSAPGGYFITLCTSDRQPLLGDIRDGVVYLSGIGRLIEEEWRAVAVALPDVALDASVIMPDHMHAIIWIVAPTDGEPQAAATSLPRMMQRFKSISTIRVNGLRGTPGARLWHRSYHDRIIRDEAALHLMRRYIFNNPRRWKCPGPPSYGPT